MHKKVILYSLIAVLIISVTVVIGYSKYIDNVDALEKDKPPKEIPNELKQMSFDAGLEPYVIRNVVYDGMTMEELAAKLDKSLNSTIKGKGMVYATKSIEYGIDPYLALAISLHETGCKWTCSYLVRECNNMGGVKGSPSCNGGSYRAFETIEDGISYFIENLAHNYIYKGLTDAETIQKKYTGTNSNTWAAKVNKYIEEIKKA